MARGSRYGVSEYREILTPLAQRNSCTFHACVVPVCQMASRMTTVSLCSPAHTGTNRGGKSSLKLCPIHQEAGTGHDGRSPLRLRSKS